MRFCKDDIKSGDEVIEFIWKPNALRHRYASYRLADIKDAARVALEMGNSPTMLFRNYRELVTEKQAAEWFAALPKRNPPRNNRRTKKRNEPLRIAI